MKQIAQEVVKVHYKDQVFSTLDFGHNSGDLEKVVQENVKDMIDTSTFHMGLTLDAKVSALIKLLEYHSCSYPRVIQIISAIPPSLSYARSFSIVESKVRLGPFSTSNSNLFRCLVL
jgi:hypothetical protein